MAESNLRVEPARADALRMVDPPSSLRACPLSLRAALDAAGVAIATVGLEGHVLSASAEFARAFSRSPEDLVGVHLIGLCSPVDQAEVLAGLSRVIDGASRLERRVVRVSDGAGGSTTLRCTFARPDGAADDEVFVVLGAALTPAAGLATGDAHHRRRRSDVAGTPTPPELRAAGLLSADTLPALVTAGLRRSGHTGRPFALIRVGLDRLTAEPARPGGRSGALDDGDVERAVAALGERMLRRLRPGDQVCHHDGDGFAVLAEDLGDVQDAAGVAYRLLSMAVEPLAVGPDQVRVSLTVGLAVADTATTAGEIPPAADRALDQARDDGAGGFRIVDLRSGLAA